MKRRAATAAFVALLAVLLTAVPAATQTTEADFGVFPHSGPDGILLIVGGRVLHPSSAGENDGWIGYNLYRRGESDTAFARITEQPLSRVATLSQLETAVGTGIDGLETLVGAASKQELWQRLIANDESAMVVAVISRKLRAALGLLMWDYDVERGASYEYYATRVAADGTESEPSEVFTATLGVPPVPLLSPDSLTAETTDQGVLLRWLLNPGDSGAYSYSVYRSPSAAGSFLKLNLAPLAIMPGADSTAVPGASFMDTTAQVGREYYYSVVTVDYAGNEGPRDRLVAVAIEDTKPPAIPQSVFAEPVERGIAVTWDQVSNDDVVGYHIYRSLDPDSHYTRINEIILPADTGYYLDRSTTLSNRYFYRISSIDMDGNESEPSARTLSLYENRSRPLAPQGVSAESRDGAVVLTWRQSTEPDVRGYYVFRADRYNGPLTQVSPLIALDTVQYTDSSGYLSSRGHYWYLLQSVNYSGVTSLYSTPVAASPLGTDTAATPASFYSYQDDDNVRLMWPIPDDPLIVGYHVFRTDSNTAWRQLTDEAIPYDRGEYVDTTVASGKTYRYRLRPVGADGVTGESSHSVTVTVFRAVALPPDNVRVRRDGSALVIAWYGTLQDDVAGYHVYRRTEGEAARRLTDNVVSAGTISYRDSDIHPGERYFYSVSIVDTLGRESLHGAETPFVVP